MIPKNLELEELKCELTMEEEAFIWSISSTGVRRLILKDVAKLLMDQYYFITIGEKIKEIYYYEDGIYKSNGHDFIRERIQNYTRGVIKNYQIQEIIGHIERSTYEDRKVLMSTPTNLICFKNGIYDIDTKELKAHSPKFIFTNQFPYNYNAEATCKVIPDFLKSVLKEEDIKVFQEFLGYIFYREFPYKKAVVCVGDTDSGKTTTINLIIEMIGKENTSGESLQRITSDKFATSSLYGKHLNFYDDLPLEDLKVTGQFKVVTGGGYVSGEHKFGNRFNFKNHAKLLYATNKISLPKDIDDEAYYGRWIILFFNNQFDEETRDPEIIKKITTKEEIEGLVIWSLEGLERLLVQKRFSYNKTAEENRLIMEKSSDTLSRFVQDCLVQEVGSWISKEDLFQIYSSYVNETGGARIGKEKFGRDIQLKCPYIVESRRDTEIKKSLKGWSNISLNNTNNTFLHLYKQKNNINIYGFENSVISIIPKVEEESIKESVKPKYITLGDKKFIINGEKKQ